MRSRPRTLLLLALLALGAAAAIGAAAYWLPAARWVDAVSLGGFASLSGSPVVHAVANAFAVSADTLPFFVAAIVFLVAALRLRGPRRAAAIGLMLVGANVSSQ